MFRDKNGILYTNEQEHKELIDAMMGFLESEGVYEMEDD